MVYGYISLLVITCLFVFTMIMAIKAFKRNYPSKKLMLLITIFQFVLVVMQIVNLYIRYKYL